MPGSVIGSLPPLVGWVAGGGTLADPRALIIAFFFFIWQVPHFWLLMAKHHADYRAAGFPTALETFGAVGFRRVLFVWWMLTILSGLYTAGTFGVRSPAVLLLLSVLAVAATLALRVGAARQGGLGNGSVDNHASHRAELR